MFEPHLDRRAQQIKFIKIFENFVNGNMRTTINTTMIYNVVHNEQKIFRFYL